MELQFRSQRLQRACAEESESNRLWGAEGARIVQRRLVQLAAAETLAVIATLRPAMLAALSGSRDGQFSIEALPLAPIILEPWHDPVPISPDGRVDRAKVTAVCILAIGDSH